ncbi:ABC transporter ATP-binding protein [Priestia koreensis]|uniref:ABC transporter ATP-binding protein n=1 Tax=Priestia koreensis TaxID=284581 RepID=UPI001F578387|nr:ABC transporter ATP-binding protein [Priestia koreensis]UNL84826.1 ABC transporter ATP-binding protein [Priestia koreensis]
MTEVVKVEGISKRFGEKEAVSDVSFSIQRGEVVALLGPNGAGKTTMISMILGLMKPTGGNLHLFSQQPMQKSVREQVGTMLQEVSVPLGLKVKEILEMVRHYYKNPLSMNELIAYTGLSDKDLKTRAEKLSGGQKRRLNFALALAGNPSLLIFDEPTVGMDIESRKRFWDTIKLLSHQGKTILFTTHYLQEADDVAERILLFHNGRIAADGAPSSIKARLTKQFVSFCYEGPTDVLDGLYPNQWMFRSGRVFVETIDTDEVLFTLFQKNLHVSQIEIERGKLEDAFRELTTKEVG